MKKWSFIFGSVTQKLKFVGGDEKCFDGEFNLIKNSPDILDKFILNISDYRVSKRPACSILLNGSIEINVNEEKVPPNKLFHIQENDTFIIGNQKFTIQIEYNSRKRIYSSFFDSEDIENKPGITSISDELFPIGWSEPAHNLMYFRPKNDSRFRSHKGK
jgi:hypothetical protein